MYRILLVDDEALIREGVSENVDWKAYGYEFAGSCENGKEALEFIKENPVDVVLTDICMPYLDGIALSERLHEDYPEIKVIILSGYDDFDYAKQAIKYGVKGYLLKPITAQEMGEVLNKLKQQMDEENENKSRISKMRASYHEGQILLFNNVLQHLIKGSERDEVIEQEMTKVGLRLEAAAYRVAIIEIDLYAPNRILEEKQKKESVLMAFVLYNISQEIVKKQEAGEVCQAKDSRTFILFHSGKRTEIKENAKKVCLDIMKQMNQAMQLAVTIGIGCCVEEWNKIYISYEEAEKALEYRYVLGANTILEMESIVKSKGQADIGGLLERLTLHVKKNDIRKIEQDFTVLENVFRDYCYDRQSVGTILQRIVDLLENLCRMSEVEDREERKAEEILKRILSADDLDKAIDILIDHSLGIAERMDNRKNIGGRKYAVSAMDYMEKNYTDCTLSLHSVCSYLNISASRFSSIFKQVTGNTFMDVLIGLRMHKAKELLENTDLKNYEIAEKVGFNDPHYFSVAFKRITGKSPTEYAKEMRK